VSGKLLYTRICATLGCSCHGLIGNNLDMYDFRSRKLTRLLIGGKLRG